MIDPNMTSSVPEYILLSICASTHSLTDTISSMEERMFVTITGPSTLRGTTLTKLQQMLSSKFGLRWEESGCALRGTYTSNPVHTTYNSQDAMHGMSQLDEMITHLLQLISNGDFGNDFGFDLISSNSSGIIFSAPDSRFEHRSVFRRLVPWYKHAGIPQSRLPRKRNVDAMTAGSREPES